MPIKGLIIRKPSKELFNCFTFPLPHWEGGDIEIGGTVLWGQKEENIGTTIWERTSLIIKIEKVNQYMRYIETLHTNYTAFYGPPNKRTIH